MAQGCNSQKPKAQEKVVSPSDTTNPKVSIKVNKKYDEKGNLVQYDSSYSYFYSTPGGNIESISSDSFYNQFGELFHSRYNDFLRHRFDNIFFNDSLYKYDLLNRDFFDKRFELNNSMFYGLFREMDSLKMEMLKHSYPNGVMKRKE
jgi:hypothetical protein